MNRIVLILVLAWLLGANCRALDWEESERTIQAVPGQKHVQVRFTFVNSGPRPVKILSVQTTCGCTVAQADHRVVAPGGSGGVDVLLALDGIGGATEKIVLVRTDEPGREASTVLRLKVNPRASIAVQPQFLFWGRGSAGIPKAVEIRIPGSLALPAGLGPPPFDVSGDRRFRVALVPEGGDGHAYRLWVTPVRTDQGFMGNLTVRTRPPIAQAQAWTLYVAVK